MENEMLKKLFLMIEYENDELLDNLELANIKLNKAEAEAILIFKSSLPVSTILIKDFTDYLDNHYIKNIKKQDYIFECSSYSSDSIKEYYRFIIQRLSKNTPKLITSVNYDIEVKGKTLNIKVPSNDKEFSLQRSTILKEYKKFGFIDLDIYLDITSVDSNIAELIRQERKQIINENKQQSKSIEYKILNEGSELVGKPIDLKELPNNEEEYSLFKSQEKSWNFIIQGRIAFFDKDNFEKKGTIKLILTDNEHYAYCVKRKLKAKNELDYFNNIDVGMDAQVQVFPELNPYTKDVSMHIVNMKNTASVQPVTQRTDDEPKKRVELHLHTKMSNLDGVPAMDEYIEASEIFGMKALAVTDHYSCQSFHDLNEYASKHDDFKPLFGLELAFVDEDQIKIAYSPSPIKLQDATYVVFDLETTGFSVNYERIIQISATKIQNGIVVGEFTEFVNPEKQIHPTVVQLTGITNNDVDNAKSRFEVLYSFKKFIQGCILVAHNAEFDISHLYKNFEDLGIDFEPYPVIDTLMLAKALYPDHKSYGLSSLTKLLGVKLDNHHRADADATATAEIFLHMLEEIKSRGIEFHHDLNSLIDKDNSFKYPIPGHINLIAKTQEGIVNLYHILSLASTTYFGSKEPVVTRKILEKYRTGILVGSGCRNSHFFDIAFRKSDKEMEEIIDFYDYIEVQPMNTFDYYKNHMNDHVYAYTDTIKRIIHMAKKHGIPVCATGDCHQINNEDVLYRKILVATDAVGGGYHYMRFEKEIPSEYFMTTREMLDEFSFLGEQLAYEIVVENTNLIADACEKVQAFTSKPLPPKDDFMASRGIPSAEEYVKTNVQSKAEQIYGNILPPMVKDRIKGELEAICDNKFSTIYLISKLLVEKSRNDGYVVGSRGSVGSSFVAYLMNITEVNSLPPHYYCPRCHYSTFKMSPEEKNRYGIRKDEEQFVELLDSVYSGYDLPYNKCPICGGDLKRDGHDIPFETFLGVPSDPKTPDIDLNFSGENQRNIHEYIRELFGETKAFRAGTIQACKDKISYAIVRDYFDLENETREKEGLSPIIHQKAEIEAISNQINGIKRTSSQHPGGIVVVPSDHEIYEITPVQYPGDSKDRSWMTTHFEYHSFEKNLFKLDVLGHDDPTVIRYLMKYVKLYPEEFPFDDALDIPVDDNNIYQMMNGTKVLGVDANDIASSIGTYGISEFGTVFVRGLLEEARPKTFAELVKVSGLSHGTDVWKDNAEALLLGEAKGYPKQQFKDIIGCRDDIMLDLISFGVPADLAFQTMEFVRKGKPTKDAKKWLGFVEKLQGYNVPEWYIWSCSKIKYMFPKAHATAYVIMALRIAWFKLYRPIYFYSAILSKKMVAYDVDTMRGGIARIRPELERLRAIPQNERKAKDDDLITTLELALEMCVRGFKFYNVNRDESEALDFRVSEDKQGLYIPFAAIDGLGGAQAEQIVKAREEKPFTTKKDFEQRTRVSKTLIKKLEDLGVFEGLQDDSQLTLDLNFDDL